MYAELTTTEEELDAQMFAELITTHEERWFKRVIWQGGQIKKVAMSNQFLDDYAVMSWCMWFQSFHNEELPTGMTIPEIDFSNNFLTEHGVDMLLKIVMKNHIMVEILKLYKNKIQSGTCLAKFIEHQANASLPLMRLQLSHNQLDVDDVKQILCSAVFATTEEQVLCYPHLDQPLWLRVEHNAYWEEKSEELERVLTKELDSLGRPMEEAVCLVMGGSKCYPETCSCLNPPPAVHATYLFSHRCPKDFKKLAEPEQLANSKGWPLCIEDSKGKRGGRSPPFKVVMRGHAMSDAGMKDWCAWFKHHSKMLHSANSWIVFETIDFTRNKLTNRGLKYLFDMLEKNDITPVVLKYDGEAGVEVLSAVSTLPGDALCDAQYASMVCTGAAETSLHSGFAFSADYHASAGDALLVDDNSPEGKWAQLVTDSHGHSLGQYPPFDIWMKDTEIDDGEVLKWCSWFKGKCRNSAFGHSHPTFKTIDFSHNSLTDSGVQGLINTLMEEKVHVETLKLNTNKFESSESIVEFIHRQSKWSTPLLQLHLSHNKMHAKAVSDVILSVVTAKVNGMPCYPHDGRPLWLRVEHNEYWKHNSHDLQKMLTRGLSKVKKYLSESVCTASEKGCCPTVCLRKCPPMVHARFLFSHWSTERQLSDSRGKPMVGSLSVSKKGMQAIVDRFKSRQLEKVSAQVPLSSQLSFRDPHSVNHHSKLNTSVKHIGLDAPDEKKVSAQVPLSNQLSFREPHSVNHHNELNTSVKHIGLDAPDENGDCASPCISRLPLETFVPLVQLARLLQRWGKIKVEQEEADVESNAVHCFVPGTFVLSNGLKALDCAKVKGGTALWCGHLYEPESVIRDCCRHPESGRQEQQIIKIDFACRAAAEQGSVTLTADHPVAARQDGNKTFKPILASELKPGDVLRTFMSKAVVQAVRPQSIMTQVAEVELEDLSSTMFVGHRRSSGYLLKYGVEVYGKFAMSGNRNTVRIFSFRRFDNFRSILLESSELKRCRDEMAQVNVSADLSKHNLGPGKMLVGRDMAVKTLVTLNLEKGMLKASQVVVSSEFEPLVLELIKKGSYRVQYSPPEVLEVRSWKQIFRNGFVNFEAGSISDCVHSSVCGNVLNNPRKKAKLVKAEATSDL